MQMDHTSHNQAFALHTSYVLTSLVSIPCYILLEQYLFHVALAKGKKNICTITIFMKIRAAEIRQELENRVQYL